MTLADIEYKLERIRETAKTDWRKAQMLEAHLYMDVLEAIGEEAEGTPVGTKAALALEACTIVADAIPPSRLRNG